MDHIAISKFKARCLALLESVNHSGHPLLITRRGKPLARVVPVGAARGDGSPVGCMAGTAQELADITLPVDADWSALGGNNDSA